MARPVILQSLSPREAITDALYCCVIGLDSNNRELFESAWTKEDEVCFDMGGKSMHGKDAIAQGLFAFIGPLNTQHMISNIRVAIKDGEKTASMTAYALAQHHRPGESFHPNAKRLMSGSEYFVDLVEDSADRVWKIRKWAMTAVWLDGDASIVGQ